MIVLNLDFSFRTNHDTATTCLISILDTVVTIDGTSGGEVRSRDIFHKARNIDFGIVDISHTGIDGLSKVMCRHVSGHTYGNTRSTVDQEVGITGGEHHRLLA